MLEDFFFRALLGGIGVAIVAGPVGCFIIWRRLAYFGDTLSHSALLGVAMALLLELNITLSVFFISLVVSLLLLLLQKRASLSSDALLGLLAHATLAVGLVVLAFMTWVRVDLMGFLFGDILAVTTRDLAIIWFGDREVDHAARCLVHHSGQILLIPHCARLVRKACAVGRVSEPGVVLGCDPLQERVVHVEHEHGRTRTSAPRGGPPSHIRGHVFILVSILIFEFLTVR